MKFENDDRRHVVSHAPAPRVQSTYRMSTTKAVALACLVLLVLTALRGLDLYFAHSLTSVDGAMQTLFALDAFANGRQLGVEFQSYLGVTLILFLVPGYLIAGSTLFAASLSANAGVLLALVATGHGILRLFRGLDPGARMLLAAAFMSVLYHSYLGIPGNSLRPLRWALPFLLLPLAYPLFEQAAQHRAHSAIFSLGLAGGIGLLWSNDAGIPTLAGLAAAMLLCRPSTESRPVGDLVIFFSGAMLSLASIVVLTTHGAPSAWLFYNFVAVPTDQIWYFAPWTRESRLLGIADIRNILDAMDGKTFISITLLLGSLFIAVVRRLKDRGAPARTAAFVFLGLAATGTALLPQVGGTISNAYNGGILFLGLVSPFVVFQRQCLRIARRIPVAFRLRRDHLIAASLATIVAGTGLAALSTAKTVWSKRDSVFVAELGILVPPGYVANMHALSKLRADLDVNDIPADARLLSTYTTYIDSLLAAEPASPYGAIIHALGPSARQGFTGVIAGRHVLFAATVRPDFSGWADWNLRSQWRFFEALFQNYDPVAQDFQHILWQRREIPRMPADTEAMCGVSPPVGSHVELSMVAPRAGFVAIDISLEGVSARGRGAILTAVEESPLTRVPRALWWDGPRYGLRSGSDVAAVVPVDADVPSTVRLEFLDGRSFRVADCSARFVERPDISDVPTFQAFQKEFSASKL